MQMWPMDNNRRPPPNLPGILRRPPSSQPGPRYPQDEAPQGHQTSEGRRFPATMLPQHPRTRPLGRFRPNTLPCDIHSDNARPPQSQQNSTRGGPPEQDFTWKTSSWVLEHSEPNIAPSNPGPLNTETVTTREKSTSKSPPPCAVCGEKENTKRCTRCNTVAYCGKEHQRADWKRHKEQCLVGGG